MSVAFDLSRLQSRVAAVVAALPASMAEHVPEAALGAIDVSDYAAPNADELNGFDPKLLVTEVSQDGPITSVSIIQLYDWVLDPDAAHCYAPDGIDCPTLAMNGPYTSEQLTVRPGDGATPCGTNCHCDWVARDPLMQDDLLIALTIAGNSVHNDMAAAWGA